MVATETPPGQYGAIAADFSLPDPAGRVWTLDEIRGAQATLIMFICNHCPFVQAVADRIVRDTNELRRFGIGVAAIMPNDIEHIPADAPEYMARWSSKLGFTFPYLYDEFQAAARAYGAVCTPDFFGYDADLRLRYRGRLDGSGRESAPEGAPRELFDAMRQITRTGDGPETQHASIGCSIKWR